MKYRFLGAPLLLLLGLAVTACSSSEVPIASAPETSVSE